MATYPDWQPSMIRTAELLRFSRPQVFDSSTKQTLDTTTVSSHQDRELFFFGEADAKYLVEAHLLFNRTGMGDNILIEWTTPDGATAYIQSYGASDNGDSVTSRTDERVSMAQSDSNAAHFLENDTADSAVWVSAIIEMGAAPGNILLFWAPQTSGFGITGDLTLDANSILLVTRFA